MHAATKRLFALAVAVLFGAAAAQGFYTIGTGGVTGVYYPVGGATSKIVNDADVGLRLTVESTGGSVFNISAIQADQLDLAIAQSDVVYQAYNGEAAFDGEPVESLRTVMGLHAEPMHLVCDADAEVGSFDDIAGKRVSIGNSGSGILNTVRAMLDAKGMSEDDFEPEYLRAAEAPDFLRDGRIDCFFYTVGIGGAAIQDITSTSDVDIVPLDDDAFQGLIDESPYYAFANVPAGTYGGQDEDVTLFGVKALFVTSTGMSEDDVYTIVSTILDNLEDFRAIHPALADLTPEDFLSGLGAPLHDGAVRAYEDAGLR
ncbi:MAG: TAXI family TRAP transporter solute-binding subunit [Trueperaceae bacterium]|nr:TAXI family TRAP transporter solute-binding subunit [Trueperaceae bacterium]